MPYINQPKHFGLQNYKYNEPLNGSKMERLVLIAISKLIAKTLTSHLSRLKLMVSNIIQQHQKRQILNKLTENKLRQKSLFCQ